MAPIDSQRVVSYLTSVDTIVLSVTVSELFDCNFNDLELGGSKVVVPIESPLAISYLISIVSNVVSRTVGLFEIFDAEIM